MDNKEIAKIITLPDGTEKIIYKQSQKEKPKVKPDFTISITKYMPKKRNNHE